MLSATHQSIQNSRTLIAAKIGVPLMNFHERVTTHNAMHIDVSPRRGLSLSSGVVKACAHTGRIVSRSFQIQRAAITYFLLSPSAVERNRIIAAGKINTGGGPERPS